MRYTSLLIAAAATAGVLGLSACDVKKTQEGNVTLPKFEKTQEGNVTVPKYDVTAPDVKVTTTQQEVTVPKVTTEKETITVPKIEITPAKDK